MLDCQERLSDGMAGRGLVLEASGDEAGEAGRG